jgi:hypothetical protein
VAILGACRSRNDALQPQMILRACGHMKSSEPWKGLLSSEERMLRCSPSD